MQRIQISEPMYPTDYPRRVHEAAGAVDNFIEFLGRYDTLKPYVDPLRPSEVGKTLSYVGHLGRSLFRGSSDCQKLQAQKDVEQLLNGIRSRVELWIGELQPSSRSVRTNPITVPICEVFFATDRPLTVNNEYGETPVSSGILHYGEMVVSIPSRLSRGGKLEDPPVTDGPYHLEPFVHICEGGKRFLGDKEDLFRNLNAYINEKAGCPDVLIYIHGYNTTLAKNVRRLAKLKRDLDFEGAVILYSWASAGTMQGYPADEETVCATTPLLCQFIKDIQNEVLDEYNSVSGCELNSYF